MKIPAETAGIDKSKKSFQSDRLKQRFGGLDPVRILIHRSLPTRPNAFAVPPEQLGEKAMDVAEREQDLMFAQARIQNAHHLV